MHTSDQCGSQPQHSDPSNQTPETSSFESAEQSSPSSSKWPAEQKANLIQRTANAVKVAAKKVMQSDIVQGITQSGIAHTLSDASEWITAIPGTFAEKFKAVAITHATWDGLGEQTQKDLRQIEKYFDELESYDLSMKIPISKYINYYKKYKRQFRDAIVYPTFLEFTFHESIDVPQEPTIEFNITEIIGRVPGRTKRLTDHIEILIGISTYITDRRREQTAINFLDSLYDKFMTCLAAALPDINHEKHVDLNAVNVCKTILTNPQFHRSPYPRVFVAPLSF